MFYLHGKKNKPVSPSEGPSFQFSSTDVLRKLKLGATVPGLPEAQSRVTAQRAETKEAPGELGSVGLPLLCGEDAVFSGGTKQLPQAAVGVLGWVRLSQRTHGK